MLALTIVFLAVYVFYVVLSAFAVGNAWITLDDMAVTATAAKVILTVEFVTLVLWTYEISTVDYKPASAFALGAAATLVLWICAAKLASSNSQQLKKQPKDPQQTCCRTLREKGLLALVTLVAAVLFSMAFVNARERNGRLGYLLPHLLHRTVIDLGWVLKYWFHT